MQDDFTPLTIEDYAAQALTIDQRSHSGSLTFPLLSHFGLGSAPDCRTRRALLHLSYSCASPSGPATLVTHDPEQKSKIKTVRTSDRDTSLRIRRSGVRISSGAQLHARAPYRT